jgi:hypothetical protein
MNAKGRDGNDDRKLEVVRGSREGECRSSA